MPTLTWIDRPGISTVHPLLGYEAHVVKWSKCWAWAIDTDPSNVLRMDGQGRITELPGGKYVADGTAATREDAKAAAAASWSALWLCPKLAQ